MLYTASAKSMIKQWYWCGVFGELYGSANETRYANDIEDDGDSLSGVDEESLIEALLKEAEDDELPEKVEDELIDDAETAAEMSDEEVDAIDDVYDDDLLDDVAGED